MHLTLSRCTSSDFDELLRVQYRAFAGMPEHAAAFGPDTPANRGRLKAAVLAEAAADPCRCWLKLVDRDAGRIVAGALWSFYLGPVAPESSPTGGEDGAAAGARGEEQYPGGAKGEAEEEEDVGMPWVQDQPLARRILRGMAERKRKYGGGRAHIWLDLLFTDPDYQRRGAGSILARWGCELADRLMLPVWVEASPAGRRMYEQNGFVSVEVVPFDAGTWTAEFRMMKRGAKTALEAGEVGGQVRIN